MKIKSQIKYYFKYFILNSGFFNIFWQCCGSGMIYSGSGSSYEFSEFRIRIQAKVPDPCGSGSTTLHFWIRPPDFLFYLKIKVNICLFIRAVIRNELFQIRTQMILNFFFICIKYSTCTLLIFINQKEESINMHHFLRNNPS